MLKKYSNILLACSALTISSIIVSCSDDDDNTTNNISGLEKVSYEKVSRKLISSENTGFTEFDPITNSHKKVFRETFEDYELVPTPTLLEPTTSSEVIYPGSILRGSSFLNYSYDPLVLSNKFNQVTLSLSLKGANGVFDEIVAPTLSGVRSGLNKILTSNQHRIQPEYVPSDFFYQSDSITHEESFSKSFSTHVDFKVGLGLVSGDFSYKQSSATIKQKSYVMVKLTQKVYSASIDSKNIKQWVDGDINPKECGTHEPVFISNVDYGRIAYFLLETEMSTKEAHKMVNLSVGVALGAFSGGNSTEYNEHFKKHFNEKRVKTKVIGGPEGAVNAIGSYADFMNFIKNVKTDELIKSSAPISYTVRRLFDNTKVDVVIPYKESLNTLKD